MLTKDDIVYTTEQLPKSRRKILAEVKAEAVAPLSEQAILDAAKDVKLAGFRPGKAPLDLAVRHLGADKVRGAILERILPMAYATVVEAEKLQVLSPPEIKVTEIGDGKPIKFEAEVDVMPPVKLGDYQSIRLKPENIAVTEAMIEEALISLRRERAKVYSVDRGAKKGDLIEISFTGKVKGVAKDQLTSQRHPLILGEGKMVPGFEDELIGLKRGESKTFTLTLPKEGLPEDLAGQNIEFEIKMLEVQAQDLPELSDEFAAVWGVKTAAELKTKVKDQLNNQAKQVEENNLNEKAVAELIKRAETELPEALIHEEAHRQLETMRSTAEQQGLKFDDYLLMIKQTEEGLVESFGPEAERRVKAGLSLAELARQEGIELKEDGDLLKVVEKLREIATKEKK